MKHYVTWNLNIISFHEEDVIRTSPAVESMSTKFNEGWLNWIGGIQND